MSQKHRKSQRNKSQPSKAETGESSQHEENNIGEITNKCVRYFLTKMYSKIPIKRADIVQHVYEERPGKTFDNVIDKASKILNQVYGLNIEVIDTDLSSKKYFISNSLTYAALMPNDYESDLKSTVLFLILSHIFMSKNNSTDTSLWNFLNEFDITPKTTCASIGSLKNYITQTLVKQNYIVIENRGGEHDDGEPKKRFRWGSRAEEVVSKMEILKFYSEMYNNQDIESWSEQYNAAVEQFAGVND